MGTCTDDCGILCTDTQTRGNTSKDARRRTKDCVRAFTDVSNDSTGLHRSTCPYISTKDTGVQVFTYTDESKVKTVLCGRTDAYYEYERNEPMKYICTYICIS